MLFADRGCTIARGFGSDWEIGVVDFKSHWYRKSKVVNLRSASLPMSRALQMKRLGWVIAGAAASLLAMRAGFQAASDRIIGEEDSPPPFLTLNPVPCHC